MISKYIKGDCMASNKLVALVQAVGIYSQGFEATLRVFERHVKAELREDIEFEESNPNLDEVVDHLRNGGNVIIDSGYLPEKAAVLEQKIQAEITSGKMLEEVRGRFLATGLKVSKK